MDRVDIKSQWRTPYAFIVFADAAAAEEAVKGENRRTFSGYTLRVPPGAAAIGEMIASLALATVSRCVTFRITAVGRFGIEIAV